MTWRPAFSRPPRAAAEEMTALEYGLAAAFLLMALIAALPRATEAAAAAARLILAQLS